MQPSLIQRAIAGVRGILRPTSGGGSSSASMTVLPQGSAPPARGTFELLKAYGTMPWLRAVSERIARGVAGVEWSLYFPTTTKGRRQLRMLVRDAPRHERRRYIQRLVDTNDVREIETHPLLDTWKRPNAFLDGFTTRMLTVLWLDLGGDAGWLLERNLAGMPIAWWPLQPDWILSTPTAVEPGWRVNLPGWSGTIPAGEVIYFGNPNPADPYGRGASLARALADELETDEFASKHLKQFFFNRARPDVLVWGQDIKDADKAKMAELKLGWRQRSGAAFGALSPFFMRVADINVKEWTQTFESMQLSQLRADQRDAVMRVFGVPPEVFGVLESSNRATIESADFLMQKYVVLPRVKMLQAVVQAQLVPLYDERLVFEFESPVEEDREFALKAAQAQPAAPTVDEWRELQRLSPHQDPASGKSHLVPFSTEPRADLRPAEKLNVFGPEPPPGPPEGDDPEPGADAQPVPEEDDGEEEPDQVEPAAAAAEERSAAAGISTGPGGGRPRAMDFYVGDLPHVHLGFAKRRATAGLKVRGYSVADLVALIHAVADRVAPAVSRTLLAALQAGRDAVDLAELVTSLSAGQVSQLVTALPFDAMEKGIRDASSDMRRALLRAGELTAKVLSDQTSGGVEFRPDDPGVAKWLASTVGGLGAAMILTNRKAIERTAADFVAGKLEAPTDAVAALIREQVGLDQQRGSALRSFLDQLVDEQIPGDQLAASLARAADALRQGRAAAAGADQAMASANSGRYQAWQQAIDSGEVPETAERTWVTSDDANVCPICDPMDGQTVEIVEYYYSPHTGLHYLSPGPPPDGPHSGDRCGEFLVF